ncbi:hypothetical protein QAD02_002900 [Eretmocerus hayati]|uniref:Uncharacterized protein n=1 Tax=Eretmocerus hayati TaxID=131215 RepID=A0ACC2NL64_9HYME|nr:hypothetical protein QAD02_002900 [Eretmocerus hayati]
MTIDHPDAYRDKHHITFLDNGLVSESQYYILLIHLREEFIVGRYSTLANHPIRDYRALDSEKRPPSIYLPNTVFDISLEDFQTLRLHGTDEGRYVEARIVDAFGAILLERQCEDVLVVPANVPAASLARQEPLSPDLVMFHIRGEIKGELFMLYLFNRHWCLFMIDARRESVTHLDSKLEQEHVMSGRSLMCFENFRTFLKSSLNVSDSNLENIQWRCEDWPGKIPLQADNFNCAPYLMHTIVRRAKELPFHENFDPMRYIVKISQKLLRHSDDMRNTCLKCESLSVTLDTSPKIVCIICHRWIHRMCPRFDIGECAFVRVNLKR